MILTENGVLKLMQRIKSFITAQLNTKANSVHTHTISEIDDLSSLSMGGGYTKSEVDSLLNGKSDTSHTHTKSEITDFPSLATVATSGSYNDLSNKPTIPSKTSDLTNDSCIPLAGTNALSGSIVPSTNETVNLGSLNNVYNITYSHIFSSGSDTSKYMGIYSGNNHWGDGAALILYAKNCTLDGMSGGEFVLAAVNSPSYKRLTGSANGTLTWEGQPIQYVSDQRLKQQITEIDDKLLDAWEDVDLVQFKYNDAVDQKGDNARLHTGYVVQQIDEACKSHNIDISEYGLYCHEEYPEETEEVEVKQDDGTIKKETKVIREASEHYSLRYTEALVVECAYLCRENNRLKERLSKIEKLLNI